MSSKNIVLGALLTALTIILLYFALLIPTNTLSLLTLAAFMTPIALIRGNLKTAWLVYICSSLLGVIFLPLSTVLLYIFFFGCYGIIKSFIERLNQIFLENALKLVYFNCIYFLQSSLFKTLLPLKLLEQSSIIIWCGTLITFFIFDYALSLLIDYYYKYFRF